MQNVTRQLDETDLSFLAVLQGNFSIFLLINAWEASWEALSWHTNKNMNSQNKTYATGMQPSSRRTFWSNRDLLNNEKVDNRKLKSPYKDMNESLPQWSKDIWYVNTLNHLQRRGNDGKEMSSFK